MTRRILFVDDEPNILSAIRRFMHPHREQYESVFAGSGEDGLALLEKQAFDVVVSDMRMPGMDGSQLLYEVMRRWPNTVRIILSGQSDKQTILRSIGPTHQFLSKPCSSQDILDTVNRSCALRELLADAQFSGMVSKMTTLPTLPSVYAEVVAELQSGEGSVAKIGESITRDLGMSTKVLQLVNSSFFGLPQRISAPSQAVALLGLDTLKAIFLSSEVFTQFDGLALQGFSLEASGRHSVQVGSLARAIALSQDAPQGMADDSAMAGMLHDVGKLVLAVNLGEAYGQVLALARAERRPLYALENERLNLTHAEVGAFLLGLWGLPDTIIEAIVFHHDPANALGNSFSALTAVHVADCLVNMQFPESDHFGPATVVNMAHLKALGLEGRLPAWKSLLDKQGVGDD